MDIMTILIVLIAILISMTLHEYMHGFVAYRLGDRTAEDAGRLSLNPLKHIDPILTLGIPRVWVVTSVMTGAQVPIFGGARPVPVNPNNIRHGVWGVALMAASGPLTNLVLAFLFYGLGTWLGVFSGAMVIGGGVLNELMVNMVLVNIGFFAFNIIPLPPLDGSRVLYSVAPDFVRRAMDAMERSGGLIFIFLIVFVASSFIGTYISQMSIWLINGFAWFFGWI